MKSLDLSTIIVTYNAASFVGDTITSLLSQTGLSCEIIVVDNASTDDTVSLLKHRFPQVKILESSTNLGFSRANNLGLKHAAADTILFLNPDVIFNTTTDLLLCFNRLKQDKNIGALTPRINLGYTQQIDATCHRGFPTPWAGFTYFSGLSSLFPTLPLFNHYTKRYLGYDTEHPIDSLGGMFVLTPRRAGDAIGWWDEDYQFYGEDLDYCFRLKQKKYTVLYYPTVTVNHLKGSSTGMSQKTLIHSRASKATTQSVKAWSIQAMELFYSKHYAPHYPRVLTFLVKLGIRLLKFIRVGL